MNYLCVCVWGGGSYHLFDINRHVPEHSLLSRTSRGTVTQCDAHKHVYTCTPRPSRSFVRPWLSCCAGPAGCRPQNRKVDITGFFSPKSRKRRQLKNTSFKADTKYFVLYWMSTSLSRHGTGRLEMTLEVVRAPSAYFLEIREVKKNMAG